MRLRISKTAINALPIDFAIILEEWTLGETPRLRDMIDLMARFAVEEDGTQIDPQIARKTIGGMPIAELGSLTTKFGEALRESAVPPQTSEPLS